MNLLQQIEAEINRLYSENEWNESGILGEFEFTDNLGNVWYMVEVEDLPIEDEGKYSNGGTIYELTRAYNNEGSGIYFREDFSRSGSYYSDYDYTFEKPYQVTQVEKIIKVWRKAK